ncbi:rod shape-determining protein [Methanolobus psychrotolerans]|uniref:rod shape-determining protein n=1 Tax=Methanolobus psychrotolerans TaxID=1874706 RepID=UPI000B91CFAE|nr:rod shape-determining protein [Methanolobus psychrotolerans]
MVDHMEDFVSGDNCLYLGIDAGMFKTSVCTSDGKKFSERTVIAFLQKDSENAEENLLFGKQALELTDGKTKEPLNDGLKSEADIHAFKEFLISFLSKHDVDLNKEKTYAIIGIPSNADREYKKNLLKLSREIFSGAMLVDELFCMAYEKALLKQSMIVDIGFNKADICVINSNVPQNVDCLSIPCAGKDIDREIVKLIIERWPDSKVTEELAREWKEKYGHLCFGQDMCVVDVPLENGTIQESIAEEIQIACEFVITDIVSGITRVLSDVDLDTRESLRNNIHIFGGTGNLSNVGIFIENELKELGGGKVFLDLDAVFGISEGALELARNMPLEFWGQLVAEKQDKELIV